MKTSPHEEYRELQGKWPPAQLHHPNSGMSDDVAVMDLKYVPFPDVSAAIPELLEPRDNVVSLEASKAQRTVQRTVQRRSASRKD